MVQKRREQYQSKRGDVKGLVFECLTVAIKVAEIAIHVKNISDYLEYMIPRNQDIVIYPKKEVLLLKEKN